MGRPFFSRLPLQVSDDGDGELEIDVQNDEGPTATGSNGGVKGGRESSQSANSGESTPKKKVQASVRIFSVEHKHDRPRPTH